ncbi:hypothetical protein JM93_00216 [Roseibium hamelinense]|uniref:Uncharacterized protein n=2 Tax=Roseibium hamelinense TaxID=150831 RepID=A0A562TH51_9HYPH|nr:hypothetical protein JM93_00216 [Roseibium hamelinense]
MQAQRIKPAVGTDASPVKRSRIQPFLARGPLWQHRIHPAAAYLRVLALPLLAAAVWSHTLFGAGPATGMSAATVLLLLIAPRFFPAASGTPGWAAKSLYGERMWLNRINLPIPEDDARSALILFLTALTGLLIMIWGALAANALVCLPALLVAVIARFAFQNRMAILYERMRDAHPLYRFWSVSADNDNPARKRKSA